MPLDKTRYSPIAALGMYLGITGSPRFRMPLAYTVSTWPEEGHPLKFNPTWPEDFMMRYPFAEVLYHAARYSDNRNPSPTVIQILYVQWMIQIVQEAERRDAPNWIAEDLNPHPHPTSLSAAVAVPTPPWQFTPPWWGKDPDPAGQINRPGARHWLSRDTVRKPKRSTLA